MGASEHEHRLVEGKIFLGLINQSHFAVQKIWSDEKKFNFTDRMVTATIGAICARKSVTFLGESMEEAVSWFGVHSAAEARSSWPSRPTA